MIWLLKALGFVKTAFRWLLGTVTQYPWQAGCIALLIASVWLYSGKQSALADRDSARAEAKAQAKAHRATIELYEAAQRAAKEKEAARLARVKAQQEKVTEDVSKDYRQRIADLHARYQRLRDNQAPGSEANGFAVSGISDTARGSDAAPGQDGLSDRLICSIQSTQLDELITWVERQTAIDPNEGN